jgi:signal transduction histidine kinase
MYAELLQELIDEEDEKQRDHLHIIVSESQRLSRLIGNVLSFGRQQRNQLTIRRALGRIDQTVAGIIDQFRPGLVSQGFEISQKLDADGDASFDADALRQIISNLLSNVEKYAVKGKWVGIDLSRENDRVLIQVRDHGPGIPRSQRDKIFKPFFRLSQNIADGVSGTGIGLSIARELSRLHGGDLKLLDSDGGAVFELTVTAPLSKG